MITETEMYWLTRMTSIQTGVFAIGLLVIVLSLIATAIGTCAWCDSYGDNKKRGRKAVMLATPGWVLGIVFLFGSIFIPSTKEMCAIKAIPMIANNEQVQKLPNKVIELANDWINELKPKTQEGE